MFTFVFISMEWSGSLEKAVAPHSSTLTWKIPWMEEPGRLQSMRCEELDTAEQLHFHFSLSCMGGGNGNPLQYSCLENLRDGGAWWAAVYGVAQSRTRVSDLAAAAGCYLFLSLKGIRYMIIIHCIGLEIFLHVEFFPIFCTWER